MRLLLAQRSFRKSHHKMESFNDKNVRNNAVKVHLVATNLFHRYLFVYIEPLLLQIRASAYIREKPTWKHCNDDGNDEFNQVRAVAWEINGKWNRIYLIYHIIQRHNIWKFHLLLPTLLWSLTWFSVSWDVSRHRDPF